MRKARKDYEEKRGPRLVAAWFRGPLACGGQPVSAQRKKREGLEPGGHHSQPVVLF